MAASRRLRGGTNPPVMTATFGPIQLRAILQTPKPKKQALAATLATVEQTSKLFLGILAILAFVLLAITLVLSIWRAPVVIEPVTIPKSMNDLGYTDEVVATRLHDVLQNIKRPAETEGASGRPPLRIEPSSRQIDIAAPGTGASLATLANMARSLMGRPQTRVSGEMVCPNDPCKPKDYKLRIRLIGSAETPITLKAKGDATFESYFEGAGESVMKELDPYALVHFLARDRLKDAEDLALWMRERSHVDRARAANRIGVRHYNEGEYDHAIKWLRQAVEGGDGYPEAHAHLATVYLVGKNDYSAAAREFEKAAETGDNSPESYVAWGDALAGMKNYEAAFLKYQNALALRPGFLEAYIAWGDVLYDHEGAKPSERRTSALEAAKAKYGEALTIEPNNTDALISIADIQFEQGEISGAMKKYEKVTEVDPNSSLAYLKWGDALANNGDMEAATKKYATAANIRLSDSPLYYERGASLRSRLQSAARRLDKNSGSSQTPDTNPGSSQTPDTGLAVRGLITPQSIAFVRWGEILASRGEIAGAVDKFERAVQVDPANADALVSWGAALMAKPERDVAGAVAKYEQALRLKPKTASAYLAWGDALTWLPDPDYDLIIEKYMNAVTIDREFSDAFHAWGIALANKPNPNYRDAISKHELALKLNPELAAAHVNIGNARTWLGDYEGAIKAYDEATRIEPNNAQAWRLRGNALASKPSPDYKAAISQYERALEADPTLVAAQLDMGKALGWLGDHSSAIVAYEKAVALEPNDSEAHRLLGDALTLKPRPDHDSAITQYEQAVRIDGTNAEAFRGWGDALSAKAVPDHEKAIEKFRAAINIKNSDANTHYGLGRALSLKPQPDHRQALIACGKAAALNPKLPLAHFCLGFNHATLGEGAAAIGAYEEFLKRSDSGDDAERARSEITRLKALPASAPSGGASANAPAAHGRPAK